MLPIVSQLTLPARTATAKPLEVPAVPAAPPSAAIAASGGGRHALVIEDEAPIRALLARMLSNRD